MFRLRKTLIYLSILSILVATLGVAASPALASSCAKYHTVQKGEYLVQIGRYYGIDWRYIAQINGIYYPWVIYPGQQLCIKLSGGAPPPPPPPSPGSIMTFSIVKVVQDQSVTIQTYNMPAKDTFTVTMGPMGSKGINGYVVGKTDSGKGGSRQFTYDIPGQLKGSYQIAIRMQSPTSGFFAYNWFYNNTSGKGGQPPPPSPGYKGFPTFYILSVHRDKDVTVQAYNLPPNDTMVVTMGPMGTKGINGIQVATIDTKAGGNKQFTFVTPSALYGSYQIAVRMQSYKTGYFAYNWFYNNTFVP
jgi:LysM repeat protein